MSRKKTHFTRGIINSMQNIRLSISLPPALISQIDNLIRIRGIEENNLTRIQNLIKFLFEIRIYFFPWTILVLHTHWIANPFIHSNNLVVSWYNKDEYIHCVVLYIHRVVPNTIPVFFIKSNKLHSLELSQHLKSDWKPTTQNSLQWLSFKKFL